MDQGYSGIRVYFDSFGIFRLAQTMPGISPARHGLCFPRPRPLPGGPPPARKEWYGLRRPCDDFPPAHPCRINSRLSAPHRWPPRPPPSEAVTTASQRKLLMSAAQRRLFLPAPHPVAPRPPPGRSLLLKHRSLRQPPAAGIDAPNSRKDSS